LLLILDKICANFDLGAPNKTPVRVYGGLLHTMWRVDTDKASYAIKQLSPKIDLKNPNIICNYELTEHIADMFSKLGIPAVSAIAKGENHLFVLDGAAFLVYPWVYAKALDAVSMPHAMKVAEIIAKMHLINLDVPDMQDLQFDIHENEKILELINAADEYECAYVEDLMKYSNNLITINTFYRDAMPVLKQKSVISHGDLDQKNVLWDQNDNPILIDWESARRLNPTYEILNVSFDWSGSATNFNRALFLEMLGTYKESGGMVDEEHLIPAFYGVLGNCLNWMVYNIERSCVMIESENKNIGVEQVVQSLATISWLQKILPDILTIIKKQ
jgi:thiamine kinase-like enzyme